MQLRRKGERLLGPWLQPWPHPSQGHLGFLLAVLNVRASPWITCHYSAVLWFGGCFCCCCCFSVEILIARAG